MKSHNTYKTLTSHQTDVLLKLGDESQVPAYIKPIEKKFKNEGMELASIRTFIKCLINAEWYTVNSFKSTVIRQGYKLAGLFPWSLKMFLQRYWILFVD